MHRPSLLQSHIFLRFRGKKSPRKLRSQGFYLRGRAAAFLRQAPANFLPSGLLPSAPEFHRFSSGHEPEVAGYTAGRELPASADSPRPENLLITYTSAEKSVKQATSPASAGEVAPEIAVNATSALPAKKQSARL
jgi:hypothetical protein